MKKPSMTAVELESLIRVEIEDICDLPTNVAISVLPDGDTWKVMVRDDAGPSDPSRRDMIFLIADKLRYEFDLKIWLRAAAPSLFRVRFMSGHGGSR
jgi:hypothetical protein